MSWQSTWRKLYRNWCILSSKMEFVNDSILKYYESQAQNCFKYTSSQSLNMYLQKINHLLVKRVLQVNYWSKLLNCNRENKNIIMHIDTRSHGWNIALKLKKNSDRRFKKVPKTWIHDWNLILLYKASDLTLHGRRRKSQLNSQLFLVRNVKQRIQQVISHQPVLLPTKTPSCYLLLHQLHLYT